jgi:proteasome lid subunit RPN8/RPN11
VLDAIAAHARAEAPKECCGLLVGRTDRIDEAVAVANIAADQHRHYEIDPRHHVALIKRCRETSAEVVGAYHSHPHSAAIPSETDRAQAFEQFLFVIAGPVTGAVPLEIRGYRLTQGNFRPVRLVPDA